MEEKGFEFDTVIRNDDFIVRDHRVHQVRIMPGVTFLDIIYRVLLEEGFNIYRTELKNILFKEPISTKENHDQKIKIVLKQEQGISRIFAYSIVQVSDGTEQGEWKENFQCELYTDQDLISGTLNTEQLKQQAGETMDADRSYEIVRKLEIHHYEFMKALGILYKHDDYLLAELHLSELASSYLQNFQLHPAYLDSSTLISLAFQLERLNGTNQRPFIPIFIESFRVADRLNDKCYVYIRENSFEVSASKDVIYSDIDIYNESNQLVASFRRLAVKKIRFKELIGDERKAVAKNSADVNLLEQESHREKKAVSPSGGTGILMLLKEMVADIVGKSADEINIEEGFYNQGLDSNNLLTLVHHLEMKIGKQLYPTLLFEYTNIKDLTEYLEEHYGELLLDFTMDEEKEIKETIEEPQQQEEKELLYYDFAWKNASIKSPDVVYKPKTVLLFDDDDYMKKNLKASGMNVILVNHGDGFVEYNDEHYRINPIDEEDYKQLFDILENRNSFPDTILHFWSKRNRDQDYKLSNLGLELSIYSILNVCKTLLHRKQKEKVHLLFAYQTEVEYLEAQYESVHIFLKTLELENPRFLSKTVGITVDEERDFMEEVLLKELGNWEDKRTDILYQGTLRKVRCGRRVNPESNKANAVAFRKKGVYLITGGAGGLGLILAKHLAKNYQTDLILTGRSPLNQEKMDVLREIESFGASAVYIQSDITEEADVWNLVSEVKASKGQINGVFHCAGQIKDSFVNNKQFTDMKSVLAPKLAGTVYLDEALKHETLDFFVLFSSVSAVMGNVGQADYAYGNRFMDQYALMREYKRKKGTRSGRTISINWPVWASGGMRIDETKEHMLKEQFGIHPLPTQDGILALTKIMQSEGTNYAVAVGNSEMIDHAFGVYHDHTIEELEERSLYDSHFEDDVAIIGIAGRYPGAKNLDEFWENLKAGIDCITEVPANRWDNRTYYDKRKDRLDKTYSKWGGFIDEMDMFDPLFFQISPKDAELMDPQERIFLEMAWNALEDAGYTKRMVEKRAVGVFVGVMWGHYQLLKSELNGCEISPASVFASIANRVSYFLDLNGPSISLDTMCSSSVTSIHLACESIKSGESELAIAGGVNLSIHPDKYLYLSRQKFVSSEGKCRSFGEGGDGYVPGEGVGAVILKPLKKAIRDGDRIYGLIKGCSINHGGRASGFTVPNPSSQAKVIRNAMQKSKVAPRAISYIEAHGTGTSLGDPIEMEGLTRAFSRDTQEKAFCSVGSVKSNIGHLESAAGIAGITKVLLQMKHGLIVPSLHSKELNKSIHFKDTPFYVQQELAEWKRPEIWENGKVKTYPRTAGISTFGAGGSNAHLILEEYLPKLEKRTSGNSGSQIFLFSAKNKDRLRAYVEKFIQFIQTSERDIEDGAFLEDIAYTLKLRREHYEERLAIIAKSVPDLTKALKNYMHEEQESGTIFQGNLVGANLQQNLEVSIKNAMTQEELADAALLWVQGKELEWNNMYAEYTPQILSLPSYPFLRKRYWVDSYKQNKKNENKQDLQPIPFDGDEVDLKIIDGTIALVILQDRKNTNTFSDRVIEGLSAKFHEIEENGKIKAIIVTGYDHIFSMGGTHAQLVDISEKRSKFSDVPFLYKGLLEAEVPVIAAIQGHASGGGFIFGLYADIVILSEESVYSAVFTKYGFTPGMGATYILKEKLGGNLATEMMYTAKSYSGEELRSRGADTIFQKRQDVLTHAIQIARMISEKPLNTLKVLKKELSGRVLAQLDEIIDKENEMHALTFTQKDVKERIEYYYQSTESLDETKDLEEEFFEQILDDLQNGRVSLEEALELENMN